MNTKNFFIAEAVICLLFGFALIFFPDYMAKEYLTNPDWINEGTKILAKAYGSLLWAVAIANWYTRNSLPSKARHSMVILGTLANVFLIIIHSMAIFGGVETAFTWGTVILVAIMGVWGIILLPKEKDITD